MDAPPSGNAWPASGAGAGAAFALDAASAAACAKRGHPMTERRRMPRGRTYLGTQIAFNRRSSTLDCLMRNRSEAGGRIVFSGPTPLPGEFDLTIHREGLSRRARVVWRQESAAGVEFLPTGDAGAENGPGASAHRIS